MESNKKGMFDNISDKMKYFGGNSMPVNFEF